MVVPALGALLTSLAPVLLVTTFVLYGYRFYTLSAEWVKQSGFEPVIAAWNETKDIPKQAWAQAASSFKSFQKATREASERALRSAGDASERAWQDIGEFSDSAWQGIGAVPGSVFQGTQGITARTWQGVEFFPNGTLESIGDVSFGAWQGAGSATQNAVQVTTETTSGAWEWVTVTSDGIAVDVSRGAGARTRLGLEIHSCHGLEIGCHQQSFGSRRELGRMRFLPKPGRHRRGLLDEHIREPSQTARH